MRSVAIVLYNQVRAMGVGLVTALGNQIATTAIAAIACLAAPGLVLPGFIDADNSTVLNTAGQLLIVAAFLQYADSAQNIGIGLLRGLGDTHGGSQLTLIGDWLIRPPTAWLCGHALGPGATGAWLGLLTGLIATAVMLLARFRRLAQSA